MAGSAPEVVLVGLGAIPGAWLRLKVVNHFQPMVPKKHWGTFLVNVVACFALGLVLALRRRLDHGSLWGCIGLHGGLVAGWFLLQSGLLQLSTNAPSWLVGPGGSAPNPLGGAVGLISLLILLLIQRTAVAKALRPSTGARRAS